MLFVSSTFALTPKEEKWVITLKSPWLTWEAPEWVTPFPLDEAPQDVDYWTSIIPFEEDKDSDVYIVMPTIWVVAPIVFVPEWTKDYLDMVSWKQIDINKYLDRWAMHYAKTGMPGDVGNPVIFAHSNFFANWVGDYKTIFADIMNLDVSPLDEMWFFVREEWKEKYELRKFEITQSYETVPTDVGVMRPQWWKEVTVFACTNWLAWRWILRGKYIEKDETLIPYSMKWEFLEIMDGFAMLDETKRQEAITQVVSLIEQKRKKVGNNSLDYHDKFEKYVLNYFERELIEIY